MGSTNSTKPSLLSLLRSKTTVDCDTLDASVAGSASLGPFEDCTSNQAIAYFELQHTKHADLVSTSAKQARDLSSTYPDVSVSSLAVEICMIRLALLILPSLNDTGRVHVQTNPFDVYSTAQTIAGARRIVSIFTSLLPSGLQANSNAKDRICIKIPSTWEGMQACRTLEAEGISTLATTLFTLEQAALAAEAGCRYIAPYVNELAVHFEPGFVDPHPNLDLCVRTQAYFDMHGYKTQTLPASLTSVDECMRLAGVKHITIAPGLLKSLAETDARMLETERVSMFDDTHLTDRIKKEMQAERPLSSLIDDEEKFRFLFTRRDNGLQEIKQVKAINVFADMQVKLEEMVGRYLK